MTPFAYFLVCYFVMIAAVVVAMTLSPEGHEDERGFHLGEEGKPVAKGTENTSGQPHAHAAPTSC